MYIVKLLLYSSAGKTTPAKPFCFVCINLVQLDFQIGKIHHCRPDCFLTPYWEIATVPYDACARMNPISFLRQLYSLDTLDTRFTTSSKTPLKAAVSDSNRGTSPHGEKSDPSLPAGVSPPRWKTLEFYFYAMVFVLVVPQMLKAVIDVSQRKGPSFFYSS